MPRNPLRSMQATPSMSSSDDDIFAGEDASTLSQQTRLVIAVDYGTTYTGVAYATPSTTRCELERIDVVLNWGPQMKNHDKVPSVITYSKQSEKREQQWGSSISPDAITMVHTKLELDVHDVDEELDFIQQSLEGMNSLNINYIKSKGSLPVYTFKSPEVIVEDYLSKVFQYLEKDVDQFTEELREEIPTDIVATIPTGWSDRAINSTYRALTKAGFNKQKFPNLHDFIFVTEPEAAALYTARFLKEDLGSEVLKKGSYFILCDSGGGTVDVVSYRVKELLPILELEEVGFPTAEKCGSVFINLAFKRWLKDLIGPYHYQEIDPNTVEGEITSHSVEGRAMRELMENFDARKVRFTGPAYGDIKLRLPEPKDDLTIPGKVSEGRFIIPNATMCNWFDACIGKMVNLINIHKDEIHAQGARPKNIFLVGGFGESPYLQSQLREDMGYFDMEIHRPKTSWTAVVQGAVICGVEKATTKNLVLVTPCLHSYGIRAATHWSDAENNPRDQVVNAYTGSTMAEGQMIWLLNKGDAILSTKPMTAGQELDVVLTADGDRTGQITVYRYSEDRDRPVAYGIARQEMPPACVLRYDLGSYNWSDFNPLMNYSTGVESALITLKLELSLEGTTLQAKVMWKDDMVAPITIADYPIAI